MIKFEFPGTSKGVETDKDVQQAIAGFDKKLANYKGTWSIEAGYNGDHDAFCKISGTGLKAPITAGGKKVGVAVRKALGDAYKYVNNKKQTTKDKKEHARNTCARRTKANKDED